MPTPSEFNSQPTGEWAPRTDTPKRSVFGNYRPAQTAPGSYSGGNQFNAGPAEAPLTSSQAIELAVARSFIHRYLAKGYESPSAESWAWLCAPDILQSLRASWQLLAPDQPLGLEWAPVDFDRFHNAYLAAFGHAARGSCPLNEIEYGDIKADPLFQPHRLADLAAFYRAFGLEVAEDAGERQDHLCLELEFMCVLAAKEAYTLQHRLDPASLETCRAAEKGFLREHLGRWAPAFTRRLASTAQSPALLALAEFTRRFIESECARFGVTAGSQELGLRPVDDSADRMCDSCGLNSLPPGALAAAEA